MKKLMMLAALLAMVLVAAAPALAQDVTFEGDGDDNSQGDDATNQNVESAQYCLAIFAEQNANIEQNVSGDENETGAAIGQDQIQYCEQVIQNALADDGSIAANANDVEVDGVDNDEDGTVDEGDGSEASAAAAAAAAAAASSGSAAAGAGAAAGSGGSAAGAGAAAGSGGSAGSTGVLPATGGASLLTLGAGALLVAGGLVARRIVR